MDLDGGWWVLMAVGMVLFWGLIVAGIVWIVREISSSRQGDQAPADPLSVLDLRLAKGEISPEEYRERRAILGGGDRGEST